MAVSSVGKGGGFLSFGASDANADVKNTVTTSIAGGATLAASRDIKVLAGGAESANGEAVNQTGGLIGRRHRLDLRIGFQIKTDVDGDLFANRTMLIDAAGGFKASVYAGSSSGGLGTNSDANDDDDHGIRIGQTASFRRSSSRASAPARRSAPATSRCPPSLGASTTSTRPPARSRRADLEVQAIARADSHAAALGADSDAAAYVVADDTVEPWCSRPASEIEAASVRSRAAHENTQLPGRRELELLRAAAATPTRAPRSTTSATRASRRPTTP